MAKILQIIDVDSEGYKVRLDDGRVIRMPHGGDHPQIGEEVNDFPYDHPASDPRTSGNMLLAKIGE